MSEVRAGEGAGVILRGFRMGIVIAGALLLHGCGGGAAEARPSPPMEAAAPSAAAPGASAAPTTAPSAAIPGASAAPTAAPGAAAPAAPAALPLVIPGEGTTRLEDGSTITVTNDDKVVIEDPHGRSSGESHFRKNGFSYRRSVQFMADLQQRLKAGDKEKLAELILFPLRVNQSAQRHRLIQDRAAFVRDFEQIFNAKVTEKVLAADPRKIFCNYQGVMLGDGILWVGSDSKETSYGVRSINQP